MAGHDESADPSDAAPEPSGGPPGPSVPGPGRRAADRQPPVPAPPGLRAGGRLLPALLAVAVLAAGVAIGALALHRLPGLGDWLGVRTVDRSQPVLLRAVRDLSRFVAAEGTFQVVVDLEKNRRYVPDFLLTERTLFVGAGTVEAYVELGGVSQGAVTVDAERRAATVRLPAPQLAPARLDLARSYVYAEQRGVLNRLGDVFGGDPDRQREVFRLGERRITEAAVGSGLVERARAQTTRTLEGLLGSLGYDAVTVSFDGAPPAP
ncbi:MAG TPA: DUF4230 domain-containing protein [Pilimelia sp.]|nr:DUF4230 domain-containing protein [Pilimelia sp.]